MLMIMPSEFFASSFASFPISAQAAAVKAHAAAKAAAKFLPVKKFGFLGAIYLYTTLNFTELARGTFVSNFGSLQLLPYTIQ
jgi:hypothetical protein